MIEEIKNMPSNISNQSMPMRHYNNMRSSQQSSNNINMIGGNNNYGYDMMHQSSRSQSQQPQRYHSTKTAANSSSTNNPITKKPALSTMSRRGGRARSPMLVRGATSPPPHSPMSISRNPQPSAAAAAAKVDPMPHLYNNNHHPQSYDNRHSEHNNNSHFKSHSRSSYSNNSRNNNNNNLDAFHASDEHEKSNTNFFPKHWTVGVNSNNRSASSICNNDNQCFNDSQQRSSVNFCNFRKRFLQRFSTTFNVALPATSLFPFCLHSRTSIFLPLLTHRILMPHLVPYSLFHHSQFS